MAFSRFYWPLISVLDNLRTGHNIIVVVSAKEYGQRRTSQGSIGIVE